MYTHVFFVILNTPWCLCYTGYELFPGFDVTEADPNIATKTHTDSTTKLGTSQFSLKMSTLPIQNITSETVTVEGNLTILNITAKDLFKCPEEEKPINIGSFEVPTQRDLVIFTKNILLDMFNSYNRDAFYLLKDIKEATRAATTIENNCVGNKLAYRQCIKRVSGQCEQITKNIVKSLEIQKQDVSELIDVKICNLADMKADPILILKSLAQEKVSLEFALPGFLRLLNACSSYCLQLPTSYKNKPMRHMTDQDLVIKHFLTRKNYLELIMDSRHKTIANSN